MVLASCRLSLRVRSIDDLYNYLRFCLFKLFAVQAIFYHRKSAVEKRSKTGKMYYPVLTKYIYGTAINARTRAFLGIRDLNSDFLKLSTFYI